MSRASKNSGSVDKRNTDDNEDFDNSYKKRRSSTYSNFGGNKNGANNSNSSRVNRSSKSNSINRSNGASNINNNGAANFKSNGANRSSKLKSSNKSNDAANVNIYGVERRSRSNSSLTTQGSIKNHIQATPATKTIKDDENSRNTFSDPLSPTTKSNIASKKVRNPINLLPASELMRAQLTPVKPLNVGEMRFQLGHRLLTKQLENESEEFTKLEEGVYSTDQTDSDNEEGNNSTVWFVPGPLFCCWNFNLQKRLGTSLS